MEFQKDGIRIGTNCLFDPPFMNGAGCCKTVDHVRKLSRSLAGAIVVGSITKEERSGNSGNVFWASNGAALNSLGMPNGGAPYLKANLREMVQIAHDAGKALVVNVAGFNPEEYVELTALALELGADAVEENLGCPNVVQGDGSRKPIASFDPGVMNRIISLIEIIVGKDAPIWIKVSPYSDPGLLKKCAAIISELPVVKVVTAVNTFPSAYGLDKNGKSIIGVGHAGLMGPPLKHIGLGQIKQWRAALPERIQLIGVGGISSGKDIEDYATVGADGFQMTTELLKSGDLDPAAFERALLKD